VRQQDLGGGLRAILEPLERLADQDQQAQTDRTRQHDGDEMLRTDDRHQRQYCQQYLHSFLSSRRHAISWKARADSRRRLLRCDGHERCRRIIPRGATIDAALRQDPLRSSCFMQHSAEGKRHKTVPNRDAMSHFIGSGASRGFGRPLEGAGR
jgi:hypothetical protein